MKEKILRNYLELTSFKDFKEAKKPSEACSVELTNPKDFQLNKFFLPLNHFSDFFASK